MSRPPVVLKLVFPALLLFGVGGGVVAWLQDRADLAAERLQRDDDDIPRFLPTVDVAHAVEPAADVSTDSTPSRSVQALDAVDRFADPNLQQVAEVTPAVPSPFSFDPGQTSWDDPFDQSAWIVRGWEFESHGMFSTVPLATATFRRPYRRLMLECRLEPLAQDAGEFRLRLLAPETHVALVLAFADSELTVLQERSAEPPQVVKRGRLAPPLRFGTANDLRIAATGNRLVASWHGKIALTCDQPASQSGRELHVEFIASDQPYRVSQLRIEGE